MRAIRDELTPELSEIVGGQEPAKAEAVPVPSYRRLRYDAKEIRRSNRALVVSKGFVGLAHLAASGQKAAVPITVRQDLLSGAR